MLSFQHLRRLLIRTSRSITPDETPSSESEDELRYPEALWPEDEELKMELKLAYQRQREDGVVRRWLVFPPPSLTEIVVWTKAFAGRMNGERMAAWMLKCDERRGRSWWEVVRNHPVKGEEVYGGDFI